jgi:hypothetical protein
MGVAEDLAELRICPSLAERLMYSLMSLLQEFLVPAGARRRRE